MTRKTAAELQEGDRFTLGETLVTVVVRHHDAVEIDNRWHLVFRKLDELFPNGIPVTPKPEPLKDAPVACPFCGSNRARMMYVLPETWVECLDCQGSGPKQPGGDEAIAAWNRAVRK